MEPYGVEVEIRSERGNYTHTVARREGDNWPKFFQRVVSSIMYAREMELCRSDEVVKGDAVATEELLAEVDELRRERSAEALAGLRAIFDKYYPKSKEQ